jgi:hypothetical protein
MTQLPRFTSNEAYVPANEKRIEIDQSNLDTIYMSNFLFTIVIFSITFHMTNAIKRSSSRISSV